MINTNQPLAPYAERVQNAFNFLTPEQKQITENQLKTSPLTPEDLGALETPNLYHAIIEKFYPQVVNAFQQFDNVPSHQKESSLNQMVTLLGPFTHSTQDAGMPLHTTGYCEWPLLPFFSWPKLPDKIHLLSERFMKKTSRYPNWLKQTREQHADWRKATNPTNIKGLAEALTNQLTRSHLRAYDLRQADQAARSAMPHNYITTLCNQLTPLITAGMNDAVVLTTLFLRSAYKEAGQPLLETSATPHSNHSVFLLEPRNPTIHFLGTDVNKTEATSPSGKG